MPKRRKTKEEWEVVEEGEEVILDDEEVVGDEEEVVLEDEEVVEEDEEAVAKPEGPGDLEYALLGGGEPVPSSERFALYVVETARYFNMAKAAGRIGNGALRSKYGELSRRFLRLAFLSCPYRPHLCPLYAVAVTRCPVNLEKRCRPLALRESKPKKLRGWLRKK